MECIQNDFERVGAITGEIFFEIVDDDVLYL
jgi:hypothetical protein